MEFHVITIFPDIFEAPLRWGVLGRARQRGLVKVVVHDLREHGMGPHRLIDDYSYGGGAGMVMRPEPIFDAVEETRRKGARGPVIYLSPQGEVLKQKKVEELSRLPGMILLCGRYEGVDERVLECCVDEEISIGDYILSGGEFAALVLIDAVSRLVEGVLGNVASAREDSLVEGLLKYPQYTRPAVFRGMRVPEVLLSGNHQEVLRWRRRQSLLRTLRRRPDLLEKASLREEDREFLEEYMSNQEGSQGGPLASKRAGEQ
jgi:tRNA (guanine37-N1)-methyltransferase